MAGIGSTFKIVKLTYFTKTAIAVVSARKLFNCFRSTSISISKLRCIYRMSQKQVPDGNKAKQRLVPSNDFRWWWWQVAGGEGFLLHNNVKTAPTLFHLLISTRNFFKGHPVFSSFFINFDPFPSIAPPVTIQPHLWFIFHFSKTLTNYAVILYMLTHSDRYLAYLDICETGDWQNWGECTNSEIGFARRALQLHLRLKLFSSEIISCETLLQGLNLQILENRCVFLITTEKIENKELLKCCNREFYCIPPRD